MKKAVLITVLVLMLIVGSVRPANLNAPATLAGNGGSGGITRPWSSLPASLLENAPLAGHGGTGGITRPWG